MEQTILNSNANFVVRLLSGSVGATLTSVKNAIQDKTMEIMSLGKQSLNFLDVLVLIAVLLKFNILPMERSTRWVAQSVETRELM